jgi:hypothetical protein
VIAAQRTRIEVQLGKPGARLLLGLFIKQSAISPFQIFLIELLLFLSSEPWWRARLFCFRRGDCDLGRRGGFGLLAANARLLFISLIRAAGWGTTLPVTKLILPVTRLILPVTKWTLPVTKWTSPVTKWTPAVTRLRIAAQFANAIVLRVRPHYPTVRALRGNPGRVTLLALGQSKT